MTLDRNAVERLLALNDRQLALVIKKLMAEAGLDPAMVQLNSSGIAALRAALAMATDEDLKHASEQLAKLQKNGGKHGGAG